MEDPDAESGLETAQYFVNIRPIFCDVEAPFAKDEVYVVSFDCGQSDNGVYVGVGAENVGVVDVVVGFGEGAGLEDGLL